MTRAFLIAALVLSAGAAQAASPVAVGPCGDRAGAEYIAEPWEANIATYAQGQIRLAIIDHTEPAAAAVSLMVLAPPLDETGLRRCQLVTLDGGSGFYDMDFDRRKAAYDPAKGLTLTIPAQRFDADTGLGKPATLSLTINQRSGQIDGTLSP